MTEPWASVLASEPVNSRAAAAFLASDRTRGFLWPIRKQTYGELCPSKLTPYKLQRSDVCVPLSPIHTLTFCPPSDSVRRWRLWQVLRSCGWKLTMAPESFPAPSATGGHSDEKGHHQTQRLLVPRSWDSQPLELAKNVSKAPGLSGFVTTARVC